MKTEIMERRLFLNDLFYFKHYFIFLNLMNTWQFHMSNWQGKEYVQCGSSPFFYLYRITWVFLQSNKLNLTYCWKSFYLLAFCFLFVCMVDQTQMYPSSISPLGLFQEVICNIYSVNPLIYRGLGFLKNDRRGD